MSRLKSTAEDRRLMRMVMAELSLDIHVQAKDWQSIGVDSETQILEAQILEARSLRP